MGVFAFLLSPVLLLPAAFISLILAILICGGIAKKTVGCGDCDSDVCPLLLAVGLFVALPLGVISAYLLRRRRASKP